MWHLDGPTFLGIIVALAGLARYLLDRHDKRMTTAAKTATDAQEAALANKDREIAGWQRRYEQEHQDRQADIIQREARIAHLEDLLYRQKDLK